MKIRQYQASDWTLIWAMIEPVFRAGETYPYPPDITESDAHQMWIETPEATYVSTDATGVITGTYYLKVNQPGLGSHVCNCGYIVSALARGQGIASALCQHSQSVAVALGFKAMQFNLVVATNTVAIRLWQKLGFRIIGHLPKAFNSRRSGYVDALIMYKQLDID